MARNWSAQDRNLLTTKAVENAKPGRLRDGGGLYLLHDEHGKRWVMRKSIDGKARKFGLGGFPGVSLMAARAKRDRYEELIATGKDPVVEKSERREAAKPKHVPTFEKAARGYYEENRKGWTNGTHTHQWYVGCCGGCEIRSVCRWRNETTR